MRAKWGCFLVGLGIFLVAGPLAGIGVPMGERLAWAAGPRTLDVTIPEADRFIPVALQIRVGDTVRWTNNDSDDHTLVSDSPLNTTGPKRLNVTIPGTDSNGGVPGTYEITFDHPGTFVYYCRFHSHLDTYFQPVAPGPEGGIQDENGNFGTPMMGVITVAK